MIKPSNFLIPLSLTLSSVLAQTNHDIRLIGCLYPRWSGIYQQAEVSADELFVASPLSPAGVQIHRLDFQDPAHPVEIAAYNLEDILDFSHFRVVRELIIVAHSRGLDFYRLSNGQINHLSTYQQRAGVTSLEVRDNLVFFGSGDSVFSVLNIANPEHPQLLGSCNLTARPVEARLNGEVVYLAETELMIVKVDDLTHPRLIQSIYAPGTDLELFNNWLMLAQDTLGITIFDVSNPDSAIQVGHLEQIGKQIEIVNGYLLSSYVIHTWVDPDGWGHTTCSFQSYSLRHPARPGLVREITISDVSGLNLFKGVNGHIAISTNPPLSLSNLHIYSVDNLGIMGYVGAFKMISTNECWDISVQGNHLYSVQTVNDSSLLKIVDVSNPTSSQQVSEIYLGRSVRALTIGQERMVFYDEAINAVKFAYLELPLSPHFGRFVLQFPRNSYVYSINLYNFNAYVPRMGNGNYISVFPVILDYTPEEFLVPIEGYLTGDFVASGNYAYFPSYSDGFYVLDIHNRNRPVVIRQVEVRGQASSGDAEDGYLYITDGNLCIYSLENPEMPELICDFDVPDSAFQVRVEGRFAYLTAGTILQDRYRSAPVAILILDISDPAHPVESGYYRTNQNPVKMAIQPPRLFVQMNGSIQIFDCSDALGISGEFLNPPPTTFLLEPAYPNPFNHRTRLSFSLPKDERVSVYLFDGLGRRIQTLIPDARLGAGTHKVAWEASGYPAGPYFARIQTNEGSKSISLVLMK